MASNAVERDSPRGHFCRLRRCFPAALRRLQFFVASDAVVHSEYLEGGFRRTGETLHRPVAGLAFYLRDRHVDSMRKVDMRRQTPDSPPRNLPAGLAECPELLDLLALSVASHMAAETQCGGRPARHGFLLGSIVARRAGELEIQMRLMRELDRLRSAGLYQTGPIAPGHGYADNDENQDKPYQRASCHPSPVELFWDANSVGTTYQQALCQRMLPFFLMKQNRAFLCTGNGAVMVAKIGTMDAPACERKRRRKESARTEKFQADCDRAQRQICENIPFALRRSSGRTAKQLKFNGPIPFVVSLVEP